MAMDNYNGKYNVSSKDLSLFERMDPHNYILLLANTNNALNVQYWVQNNIDN